MSRIPDYIFAQNNAQDGTTRYYIDDLFMDGMSFDPRYENRSGYIEVGGDKGDVYIREAWNQAGGVSAFGIELRTGLRGLDNEAVEDLIHQIIKFSYDSIGGDTFIPNSKIV